MKTFPIRIASAAILVAAGAALTGCKSGSAQHAGPLDSIRKRPTPELRTLAERHTDAKNARVIDRDTELRMLSDDIRRFLYIDRPSRLSNYPITR